ncbi:MAG: NAD(P)-dependent oxidoreductase [Candidatus Roizmanbacteria bacterium]|nr:MAG: NAD(P)-dependent oxidoreductase [Candidatus Roizmanbacteria bacterium]
MKILITGGSGFLGYHLTAYLNKKGSFDLTLIDINKFNQEEYDRKNELIIADIRDKKKMDNIVKGKDVVIHCAAALPLWKRQDIYSTNIDGTKNILDAAIKHKVKRVIYISSTAVYGVPIKHPIEEDDSKVGVGPYGESKIQAENLCFKAIKKGLPVTIIRPKTFVGVGRLGVFEILFDWIHDGKRIPVFGSGKNRYQLLDVDDLVEVIYLFLDKKGEKYNDAFNIGAQKFSTISKDLEELFAFANSGSHILPVPSVPLKLVLRFFEILHLSPLYKWVYETADKDSFVSINRLIETLNWYPKYSNAQALIKAYKWYLKHYKEVKSRTSGVTHTVGWKQGILGVIKRFL